MPHADGFTDDGFTTDGFAVNLPDASTLNQAVSFLYNSSLAGTSFSKDRLEIKDTIINVKIQ